jgi:hypothetical protein|tara:strand:- start:3610 stop:4722 length:1113 start_codon:yes stop_codon:yes gene_type:complete
MGKKNPKSPKTFEEFKKGEWKGESIGGFAKEEDFKNYQTEFGKATESGKKRIAKAHGFDYTAKKDTKKKDKEITVKLPDRPVTEGPPDRPEYEGPPYYDPRTFDPTPSYMDLPEIEEGDYVSNRMAMLFKKGSPLFRQVSEAAARKFGTRGPRAQEAMMGEIIKVGQSIANAEVEMRKFFKGKKMDAFYRQMDIRMSGAMQQAVAHVSGGYGLTTAIMQDITNQWKAGVAADLQAYNIETGAEVATYATKVQEAVGMAGLDVKMADIMSKIEDNAEAASFIWDWIYGDNDLNPSEYHEQWKKKWGDLADSETETGTTDTGMDATYKAAIGNYIRNNDCENAKITARNTNNEDHYNSIVNSAGYNGTCTVI